MVRIASGRRFALAVLGMLFVATVAVMADEPAKREAPAKSEPSAKARPKLTPRQINFVKKELIPAWQAGDARDLLALLSPQVAKLSQGHREGMDVLLAELNAPSIGHLLATARLGLFRAQAEKSAPEPSLAETVLVLDNTRQQIDELLAATKKALYMSDPLPKPETLLGYRDLLFEVHVQKNELINARELVEFGKTIATALPQAKAKGASEEQQAILATSFRSYDGQIQELERDMDERSLELRVNRVDMALAVLSTASGLKDRFFAAYAIGIDGEFLLAGFKAGGTNFQRPALKNEKLAEELEQKIQRGKILAGKLLDKSRALFVGLHWWRRGRYGRGPEGNGLLKSVAATKSFEASIPLLMPVKSPVPTDPIQGSQQSPDYDRRHHYAWAWEDRQFQMTSGTQSYTATNDLGNSTAATQRFY